MSTAKIVLRTIILCVAGLIALAALTGVYLVGQAKRIAQNPESVLLGSATPTAT